MDDRPLWAPWRIDYVTGAKTGECIFCAAVLDAEHSLVVDRGSRCLTMLNAFPYASGHVMVTPRRHVGQLDELEDAEAAELMSMSQRAIVALRRLMTPAGFNVGLNLGEAAGAGFRDHLHLHVVPRWTGDTNFMPVIAGVNVLPEALAATAEALRKQLEATS